MKYKENEILEIEHGGLVTKVKVVCDYGDTLHFKILEHHTPEKNGTCDTLKKSAFKLYRRYRDFL